MTRSIAEIQARIAAREAAIARLVSAGERPLVIPGGWPDHPMAILIHRDTAAHRVGAWRLTRFERGALGHTESASYEAAIREAAEDWGGRLDEAEVRS